MTTAGGENLYIYIYFLLNSPFHHTSYITYSELMPEPNSTHTTPGAGPQVASSKKGKKKKGIRVRTSSVSSRSSHNPVVVKAPTVAGLETVRSGVVSPEMKEVMMKLEKVASERFKGVMTSKEAWLMSLLRHLGRGSNYLLPSPTFAGLGFASPSDFMSLLVPSIDTINGIIIPTNQVTNSPTLLSADARSLPMNGDTRTEGIQMTKTRVLNYFRTTGKVNASVPLVGNEGLWIWVDPYDVYYPVRFNYGDYTPTSGAQNMYWKGAFSAGITPDPYSTTTAGGVSSGLPWSVNPFQPYASNWLCVGAETPYPFINQFPNNGLTAIPIVYGSSYMIYPISVSMNVSVADNTAYTQTGMRVRGVGSYQHRLLNRVEDVSTGFYGLQEPFIKSNAANVVWSGDSWSFPIRHPAPTSFAPPAAPTWGSTPSEVSPSTTSSAGVSFPMSNWISVQKMLSQDFPVVEIIQSSQNSTQAVALSINVTVEYALSPLGLGSAAPSSGAETTVPFECPGWFSVSRSHGAVVPVDGGSEIAAGLALKTTNQVPALRLVSTVPHVDVTHPIVQKMQQTPSKALSFLDSVSDIIDKGVGVFNKVKDIVEPAMPILASLL